ncbi:MAG TPA: hypothetical protein VK615_03330 [Candidatus Binatia bacterium]|nr:hypothetical protein [Candidatus Binatia bacterium]
MSIQIPNLHTSNRTRAKVKARVAIARRADAAHAGVFDVRGTLAFDPAADDYPGGALTIVVDLSDSAKGTFVVRTVEQLDATGKHTPTLFATGRCSIDADVKAVGCRYWLMMADNKRPDEEKTPDVISFLIYDRNGKRVAYGTGPVQEGDVAIGPTSE